MTVLPSVYEAKNKLNYTLLNKKIKIFRSVCFDAKKTFSIFGKYPLFLSIPDRWQSWIPFAILDYLVRVRRWKPDVIISTYPIASAHWIAYFIHRITGIPWVVDLRDPMAQDGYPSEKKIHSAFLKLEEKIFTFASKVICTTPGSRLLYRNRYPLFPESNLVTITNGYEEEVFPELVSKQHKKANVVKILHSGSLQIEERNPQTFFQALSELIADNLLKSRVEVTFRAAGDYALYEKLVVDFNLEDMVFFKPAISYKEATEEMLDADILLLLQGGSCKFQIPAKVYEYFYARKPILALTDLSSDAGNLLREMDFSCVANIEDKKEIKLNIIQCVNELEYEKSKLPSADRISLYSRRNLTAQLSYQLDDLIKDKYQ